MWKKAQYSRKRKKLYGYKDLLSAYDVPALPNGCLDVRSRWYRLNLTVRQGARKNTLTSVGWVTHEYVTWEYRAVH